MKNKYIYFMLFFYTKNKYLPYIISSLETDNL
jgi:hypothetical protein